MANGNHSVGRTPPYEDYKSLKTYLRKNHTDYIPPSTTLIKTLFNQAGTGSEVEISEKGGETIAFASADSDLYIWAESDHADAYELAWSIDYTSEDGTEYSKSGVLHATVGTTVVKVTDDTDYYRTGTLKCITTSNTGYVAIGTENKATIYGIVETLNEESIHTRYMVPKSHTAWLACVCVNQAIATALDTYLKVVYTPYGHTSATSQLIPIPNNAAIKIEPLLQFKAATDVQFLVKGNLSDNAFEIQILEIEEV